MTKRVSLSGVSDDGGELLWRKKKVAKRLGVSTWTVDQWTVKGILPRPVVMAPGGPQCWKPSDIEAAIERAGRSRRPPRPPRGKLLHHGDK
jgi:predicted DNA-binding transcriptional regulator AlpA